VTTNDRRPTRAQLLRAKHHLRRATNGMIFLARGGVTGDDPDEVSVWAYEGDAGYLGGDDVLYVHVRYFGTVQPDVYSTVKDWPDCITKRRRKHGCTEDPERYGAVYMDDMIECLAEIVAEDRNDWYSPQQWAWDEYDSLV
jgi:hypothetical protein